MSHDADTCIKEAELKAAVREYEAAIMRVPTDKTEIRHAVNRCHAAYAALRAAGYLGGGE